MLPSSLWVPKSTGMGVEPLPGTRTWPNQRAAMLFVPTLAMGANEGPGLPAGPPPFEMALFTQLICGVRPEANAVYWLLVRLPSQSGLGLPPTRGSRRLFWNVGMAVVLMA